MIKKERNDEKILKNLNNQTISKVFRRRKIVLNSEGHNGLRK